MSIHSLTVSMNRKRLQIFLSTFLYAILSCAQSQTQAYWSYINSYKDMAVDQMQRYRIPASITLAQGLLESNAGRSTLATKANNHFGIKCGGSWTGPYVLRNDDAPNEKFRKYNNAAESYEDHSRFLQGRRYQTLYQLGATDYVAWARGLKAAGYATSPTYADNLIMIIERYNLHQFDESSQKRITKYANNNNNDFWSRHQVWRSNKRYFIVVQPNDDMATISAETGLSLKKLYKYNDLDPNYAPTQGDILYLQKKRTEASSEFKKNPIHVVEPNQSIFDIAQLYGIQMKSLYKLNKLDSSYQTKVGDILRIR